MVHPLTLLRIVAYALSSLPPLLLLIYLVTQFPRPQESLQIHPSLASVPRSNRVWEIYDEDYFPGGGYAALPYGRVSLNYLVLPYHTLTYVHQVRYWLVGPEDGEKVSCEDEITCNLLFIFVGCPDTWLTPSRDHLEECRPAASLSRVPSPTVW